MSQHIHGEVSQAIRHDYGEFVTLIKHRVRKETIIAYEKVPREWVNDAKEGVHYMRVILSCTTIWVASTEESEIDKAVERLDWIFQKEKVQE